MREFSASSSGVTIEEESRGIGFELSLLSIVALCFGMGYFIANRLQLPIESIYRALPLNSLFVGANLLGTILAWQGLRWIQTRGLVYEIALFMTLSLASSAVANSLDIFIWVGLGQKWQTSMVPHLFFFVAIIFGVLGTFRFCRLHHVTVGLKSLGIYFFILLIFAALPTLLSPHMIGPGVFEKAYSQGFMFFIIYGALTGFIAALSIQIGMAGKGHLKTATRLITIGNILISFGTIMYVQVASRLSPLEMASNQVHVILGVAYVCAGLGIYRIGTRMVELFPRESSSLPPSQFLVDIFGESIGMKVYHGLVQRLKSSEAHLSQVHGENQARAETIETLETEVHRRKQVEEALREAKDKAENANRAKSQFLAMMSHELRTPLTMIHGYGSILTDTGVHQSGSLSFEEMGERICQSSRHLQSVIEGILDFSSIELGRIPVHTSGLDLTALAACLQTFGESQVRGKNVVFKCLLPETMPDPAPRTDSKILQQILVNLIGNASKFTSNGEVVLEIHISPEGMHFHVRDTGPGIPEAELENVFEPFYQVSQGNTRRFGGVGLGLTIVKRLAEVLGGVLTLQSRLNAGTCISLFLPNAAIFGLTPQPKPMMKSEDASHG